MVRKDKIREGIENKNINPPDSSPKQTTYSGETFTEADLMDPKFFLNTDDLLLSQLFRVGHITVLTNSGKGLQVQSICLSCCYLLFAGVVIRTNWEPLLLLTFWGLSYLIHIITDHQETVCLHTTLENAL